MKEMQVEIATKEGRMGTFVCHPERGGPFAPIILYMDAPGIREELRDFARRLGTVGYAVLLPDMYYRTANYTPIDTNKLTPDSPERARMTELMKTINIAKVMDDTDAMLKFIDGEAAIKKQPIGAVGYCMSGQYAVNAAARHPDRFAAAAAIYGTSLVTDQPTSPHSLASKISGEVYFGCAEKDHYTPPEVIATLKQHYAAPHEVEVYPGADHAFGFPQRKAFHKASAERHWERLFALFGRRLGR